VLLNKEANRNLSHSPLNLLSYIPQFPMALCRTLFKP